jgi:hypothetical protein
VADVEVVAPAALLLTRDLAPTDKLVWLLLSLEARQSAAQLAGQSGLTRRTVRKCIAHLEQAGWAETPAPDQYTALRPGSTRVAKFAPAEALPPRIPCSLLRDQRTSVFARLLYGVLQLTPGFRYPSGRFTYASVSVLTGICAKTIKLTTGGLVRNGWLQATQEHQLAPLAFMLRNPVAERAQAERDEAKERLIGARYRGEAIMREFLSILVDSEEYVDDADPGFLVNPETLGKLQLDRYYAQGVGFEFQGPQHDHPTESFSEEDVARQKARDFIKLGMCVKLGIALVEVRPEELSLKTMQQKIGKLLPLRDLTGHEQLVGFLERVARGYRPKSARWVALRKG